jgi:prepilin-type N-terminal cleavage/methylation domain-containing protein
MKQGIFVSVCLLLFLTGSIVDARWIPENATTEDVQRLIRMEKDDKAMIIREQQFREKEEQQKKKQAMDVAPGEISGGSDGGKEADREISSQGRDAQGKKVTPYVSANKPGEGQHQHGQVATGVIIKGQTTAVENKETKELTEDKKIQKTGWKDWLAIGFFIIIFISSLALYLYAINRSGYKTTWQKQDAKNTNSKGLTLVEIMVATAVISISVLCILSVFRYASLVQPQTGYSTKAMTLCEEKLEEIRNRPYQNLTAITTEQERINMGPYGWVGTTSIPINGGATRTVTIKKIREIWHGESLPPTFEEVTVDETYLKAKVKVEWGSIPIRDCSGTITRSIPLKRELSVFITPRSVQ